MKHRKHFRRMFRRSPAVLAVLLLALVAGGACVGKTYRDCDNERRDAAVCSALALQWGYIQAVQRQQNTGSASSDLLIDGLPIASGIVLCQQIVSSECLDITQ